MNEEYKVYFPLRSNKRKYQLGHFYINRRNTRSHEIFKWKQSVFCYSFSNRHPKWALQHKVSEININPIGMELAGKNVIYIGGYGGIGEKCVEAFLKKSVKSLLIFDLQSNDEYLGYLQNTYKKSFVDYIALDLRKSESIKDAFQRAKQLIDNIDVVVNGSGVANENNTDQLVQINLVFGLISIWKRWLVTN